MPPAARRAPTADLQPKARPRQRPSSTFPRPSPPKAGLLGSGVVILLLVSLVIGRNEIVDKVPSAAPFYQSVGLSVEQDLGLEFNDVTLDWQAEGDVFVLVVQGQIVNLSEASKPIPPLRMAILNSDGEEVQFESIEVNEDTLSAGNRVNFSGRMVNPIDQGENFRLTFEQQS